MHNLFPTATRRPLQGITTMQTAAWPTISLLQLAGTAKAYPRPSGEQEPSAPVYRLAAGLELFTILRTAHLM